MAKVLIHIGYPKTGSTYLQQWFVEHPAMQYQPKAIAGFYDAHEVARFAQKNEKQTEYFVLSSEDLSVWKGDYNVIGFASKGYDMQTYNQHLTGILKDIFNSPYILIVTRGYAGMLRSLYSQYVRGGGILNFEEMMREFGADFSSLYDYSWLINLYRQVFGADKVIILPFELFQANPGQFTALLEDKLGIKEHFTFTSEKINASLNAQQMAATRLISKFIFKALGVLPKALQTKIYGCHIAYLAKNRTPWLVQILAAFCKADDTTVTEAMLHIFKGKAEILRDEKLFQAYKNEYLVD